MLVFVSSIGRSGTRFASEVVSKNFDVPSFHLAEPLCHGKAFQEFNSGKNPWEYRKKVKAITKLAKANGGHYFESTPVFLRGFSASLLKKKLDIGVVQLLRDPLEVAKSYANRESYPSHENRPWRLPLGLKRSLIRGLPALTPFQENLVDWVENELRLAYWRERFVDVQPLGFEELRQEKPLIEILSCWGFPVIDSRNRNSDELEKNQNPKPTIVEEVDVELALNVARFLKQVEVDLSIFDEKVYDGFSFIEQLRN